MSIKIVISFGVLVKEARHTRQASAQHSSTRASSSEHHNVVIQSRLFMQKCLNIVENMIFRFWHDTQWYVAFAQRAHKSHKYGSSTHEHKTHCLSETKASYRYGNRFPFLSLSFNKKFQIKMSKINIDERCVKQNKINDSNIKMPVLKHKMRA